MAGKRRRSTQSEWFILSLVLHLVGVSIRLCRLRGNRVGIMLSFVETPSDPGVAVDVQGFTRSHQLAVDDVEGRRQEVGCDR